MAKDPINNPTYSDAPSEPLKNSTKSGAKQSPAAAGTPTFPTSVESQESAPTHPTADTAAKKSAKKSAEPPTKPTYPAMEAKQPSGVQGSFAGGTWIALIAGALLLIMLLVFIMQNQDQVDLVLFAWNFRFPAGIGFLLAAISGALIMALVGGVRMFQLRRQIIKTDKHLVETVNSIRATGEEPGKETTR
ncbi:MAG: lipopolysaccharide assembly LapA domain-containing protein [Corynebacterium matruchotii]|uniref:LapA family protein n=1 Tax=Corynebacterium matruchotii TaxID=43768 RepID=UPI00360EB2F5